MTRRWDLPKFAEPNMPFDELMLAESLQLEGWFERLAHGTRYSSVWTAMRIQFKVDSFMENTALPASRVLRQGYRNKHRPWGRLWRDAT